MILNQKQILFPLRDSLRNIVSHRHHHATTKLGDLAKVFLPFTIISLWRTQQQQKKKIRLGNSKNRGRENNEIIISTLEKFSSFDEAFLKWKLMSTTRRTFDFTLLYIFFVCNSSRKQIFCINICLEPKEKEEKRFF